MTAPENFVSRWSRLKRGAAIDQETAPAESPPLPDAPASETFDPASLPPIESITVDTDIRAFLQSGVPVKLAQAALRRVWVSDPAIRNFIGIAENQWDFTDPTAIPGFGPMRETDDMASLVAQALGMLSKVPEAVSAEEAPPAPADHREGAVDARRRQRPDLLAAGPVQDGNKENANEGNGAERPRSSHGSAMPR
jgi:hypothetical protein